MVVVPFLDAGVQTSNTEPELGPDELPIVPIG